MPTALLERRPLVADEATLPSVANLPGRDSLAYRVGSHATFQAAMTAALARNPTLRSLAHGDTSDPTLALVDAWATTLDVLTFYQERIANEGFLRSASEQRSLQELGRAVGYELNPGVAAETYLAFTLEEGAGAPEQVIIDAGAKVQSVPGPGEQAQIFETVEKIEARPEWNVLKPKLTEKRWPQLDDTIVYLAGVNTGLKPGDGLLFVGSEREQEPQNEYWAFCRVKRVEPDPAKGWSKVSWDDKLGWRKFNRTITLPAAAKTPPIEVKVYALRLRAALFGHNAPDWNAMPLSVKNNYRHVISETPDDPSIIQWPGFTIAAVSSVNSPATAQSQGLRGLYYNYTADASKAFTGTPKLSRIDACLNFKGRNDFPEGGIIGDSFMARWTGVVLPPIDGNYMFYTISDDGVKVKVRDKWVIDHWNTHATTLDKGGPVFLTSEQAVKIQLDYFNSDGNAVLRLLWECQGSGKDEGKDLPLQIVPISYLFSNEMPNIPYIIHLDALYPQIRPGTDGWIVLVSPDQTELYKIEEVTEDARTNFNLSSKTTRLKVSGGYLERYNNKLRETIVFAQSEALKIADAPLLPKGAILDQEAKLCPLAGNQIELEQAIPLLPTGRTLFVTGIDEKTEEPRNEWVVLERMSEDRSTLFLKHSLQPAGYRRDSVTLYANVARATHGETREEVLGSGDAAQPFQQFALREAPLTYTPAATPSGGRNTLSVRVNDILWDETSTLYGKAGRARLFTTRMGPDGKLLVQFGDGTTGARLPSDAENISASYRVGLGQAGNLKAEQLRILLSGLMGVRSVRNPQAATGGSDPEAVAAARQNAAYTALTLERIVSLRDYEDFARVFAGVGKARATLQAQAGHNGVLITVVAPDGNALDDGSLERLRRAIQAARDPAQPVTVATEAAQTFTITARLIIQSGYRTDTVLATAQAVLRQAFSFQQRDYGQAVTESEILGLLQAVEGVEGADLALLSPSDQTQTERGFTGDKLATSLLRQVAQSVPARLVVGPNELLIVDDRADAIKLRAVFDLNAPEQQGEQE